ncbi:MAG: polysulfide reductase NrfD [Acidobacteria bacterium]|nr:polysulfide reductase NrfD [Acidobacteriota bacterium]
MAKPVEDSIDTRITRDLMRPMLMTGWRFHVTAGILTLIALFGFAAWGYQIKEGMWVIGKNRPVMWALYITTFVFWLGISMAGTLISGILRNTGAEWRRPITRCAEAITVLALSVGGLFPIIHLGRPEVFYWLSPYPNTMQLWPNFRSPLLWDFMAINTYLVGSLIYLYLPMIPDIAIMRDRVEVPWRRRLYTILALGWRGTLLQWDRLERAVSMLAVMIIPVAAFVHTIVGWDFGMTLTPMWKSTMFGPYFVVGAIFSGIASLIVAMVIIRKMYHLEEYLRPIHFDHLGVLLATMCGIWLYFQFAENLTAWYGNTPEEMAVLWYKLKGPFAPLYWAMVFCCFIIPMPILAHRRTRTIGGTCFASILIVIGMWLERLSIVVPSLVRPRFPNAWGSYTPTWVEIAIVAGSFAGFILLYLIFSKVFPIISIWEMREGYHLERGGHAVESHLEIAKEPAR